MTQSAAERSLQASVASNTSWAKTQDRSARTASQRAASPASLEYFEKQIDPDSTMDPTERAKRAEFLRRAHFQRLALKSAKARRLRKERRQSGGGAA